MKNDQQPNGLTLAECRDHFRTAESQRNYITVQPGAPHTTDGVKSPEALHEALQAGHPCTVRNGLTGKGLYPVEWERSGSRRGDTFKLTWHIKYEANKAEIRTRLATEHGTKEWTLKIELDTHAWWRWSSEPQLVCMESGLLVSWDDACLTDPEGTAAPEVFELTLKAL